LTNEQSNQDVCPCDFCNSKKYTIPEYLQHIDEVLDTENLICKTIGCDFKTSDNAQYIFHMKKQHGIVIK